MGQPVMLSVDDDPTVSRAIARDLRQRYGSSYRIRRAESGADALAALRELALRNERVGLLLADQRMPNMDGVQFLREARAVFPSARRVLLTAYADTEAAIAAINEADVHYFLLKPWDPPEDRLYPVIDDLLEDWAAEEPPSFDGVRVIGHRVSARAHKVKDFLARNQVPFPWFDIQSDSEASRLLTAVGAGTNGLPVVVTPDGTAMRSPAPPTWRRPSA